MENNSLHIRKDLLTDLKAGDETAFDRVYHLYVSPVMGFCLGYLKDRELAKEAVQETFLRVWTNRMKIDADKPLQGYLFTIARNIALNFLKKASADRRLCERIYYAGNLLDDRVQQELDWKDYEHITRQAIDLLPEKRRQVFLLAREQGLSYQEIAQKLDISTSTVKTHMSIAMQEVRQYLQTHGDVSFGLFFFLWASL